MSKKINLYNRYREKNYLEYIEDNKWKLVIDNTDEYNTYRVGFNDDNTINFVDPSGGPFMSVGGTVYDVNNPKVEYKIIKIEHIDKNQVFYLEEVDNNKNNYNK